MLCAQSRKWGCLVWLNKSSSMDFMGGWKKSKRCYVKRMHHVALYLLRNVVILLSSSFSIKQVEFHEQQVCKHAFSERLKIKERKSRRRKHGASKGAKNGKLKGTGVWNMQTGLQYMWAKCRTGKWRSNETVTVTVTNILWRSTMHESWTITASALQDHAHYAVVRSYMYNDLQGRCWMITGARWIHIADDEPDSASVLDQLVDHNLQIAINLQLRVELGEVVCERLKWLLKTTETYVSVGQRSSQIVQITSLCCNPQLRGVHFVQHWPLYLVHVFTERRAGCLQQTVVVTCHWHTL